MTKASVVVVAAVVGLFALGVGCAIDTAGTNPTVTDQDAAPGGMDAGKSDTAGAPGGAGGRGGTAGQGGAGGASGAGGGQGGGQAGGNPGQGGGTAGQGGVGSGDAGPDAPSMLGTGALCSSATACASGFCVDGVCCESACPGTCMACSVEKTGKLDGQCRTTKIGSDPDNECDAEAASTCGRTGRCGLGACELVAPGTTCGERSCTGRQRTPAPTCNGGGQCVPGAAENCPGSLKCGTAVACATDCASDGDCVAPTHCDTSDGKCKLGLALGVACVANGPADQCQSGNCVDGVCCESACTGTCAACNFARTGVRNGQCAAVSAGMDPDNECAAQDPATCGNAGVCNGNGACRKYPDGTACGSTCCDKGPGRGARPCSYVCRSGQCDMGNPEPTADSCGNGIQTCCCPNGGAVGAAACTTGLACALGNGCE